MKPLRGPSVGSRGEAFRRLRGAAEATPEGLSKKIVRQTPHQAQRASRRDCSCTSRRLQIASFQGPGDPVEGQGDPCRFRSSAKDARCADVSERQRLGLERELREREGHLSVRVTPATRRGVGARKGRTGGNSRTGEPRPDPEPERVRTRRRQRAKIADEIQRAEDMVLPGSASPPRSVTSALTATADDQEADLRRDRQSDERGRAESELVANNVSMLDHAIPPTCIPSIARTRVVNLGGRERCGSLLGLGHRVLPGVSGQHVPHLRRSWSGAAG